MTAVDITRIHALEDKITTLEFTVEHLTVCKTLLRERLDLHMDRLDTLHNEVCRLAKTVARNY